MNLICLNHQSMVDEYFRTARERYRIMLRKDKGEPWPWTEDKVFQTWRFCNVHREHDKTTIWFRINIRNNPNCIDVVRATFIFRWFNRIETGEKIKDLLLGNWNANEAYSRLKDVHPVVTGAYMVKTPPGSNKLDGILNVIQESLFDLYEMKTQWGDSLEKAWKDLCTLYCIGRFTAYEIVTDLRHTHVLRFAKDIHTWANAGPGCSRGLDEIVGEHITDPEEKLEILKSLLDASYNEKYWPKEFKSWELREAEHWSCEFYKYLRGQRGFRLKRRYSR